jgi:Methyltransferase domain
VPYQQKVRFLKGRVGFQLWSRTWGILHRNHDGSLHRGSYGLLPSYIRAHAPGKSFADIGCMWGVHGEYCFVAEDAGATSVKGIDVSAPTDEFESKRKARNSAVEFIHGDASDPAVASKVGEADVVFCAGVLYHHPSPFELLKTLRQMCRETLILRSATIPEMSTPQAAVYWPHLSSKQRRLWQLGQRGLGRQVGITDPYDPEAGFANWFWGLTPSALNALVTSADFRVDERGDEPFAQTLICSAT